MKNFDESWLLPENTQGHIKTVFLKTELEKQDEVAKTLKKEIQTYLGAEFTTSESAECVFEIVQNPKLLDEGFELKKENENCKITANTSKGLLYGFYELLRKITLNVSSVEMISVPNQKIRIINHWDNIDGSIERGYAGKSIYYENSEISYEPERIEHYARMLASVGINHVSINNVNVRHQAVFLITDKYLDKVSELNSIFHAFGIKMMLSINFGAPTIVGGLATSDPLDKDVIQWWGETISNIYDKIPSFGGFVIKADSEGELGPFAYGRTHAEGANMFARHLKQYEGILVWRAFVYNCQQDWRDRSTDRAKAAYDNFIGLDGEFCDNVLLQIKNGPMDFQVREPILPLFGALKKTNQILEFQITQEYTGHQKHIFCLPNMWAEVLNFDTKHEHRQVKNVIREGSLTMSGIAGVGVVGRDYNWTGNKLAQSNLYGFGKMAWNNSLTPEEITWEWLKLSFPFKDAQSDESQKTLQTIKEIILTSSDTYEDYTAPLGVGWMVTPSGHYGVAVDGYEYDRWGTYHFADRDGMGVDRTLKTGTGQTRQYSDDVFQMYENLETCPDELVLFFHHLPYTYVLKSGKTIIQHIYDTHFRGVETVKEYITKWDSLKGKIDDTAFENVADRLKEQLRSAKEWRDQINTYFYRKSGISDEQNRTIY